jgi:DNA-binding transcriptional MocR family regulator
LDLSIKYEIVLLEDDPYCDLYFTEDDSKYIPIKSLTKNSSVVYVGSFSKILCPGFRLGWMIADNKIIDKLSIAKQSIDACSSSFGQVLANDYLNLNLIDNYLKKMRKIYKYKKELMISKINQYFPKEIKATNPDGGFFIYINLPDGLKADELFSKCIEKKVAFVTGEAFHIDPVEGNKHIRLSFSNSTESEIDYGIKVMGDAIKDLLL